MDNMLKREADGLQQVKAGQLNMMGGGGTTLPGLFSQSPVLMSTLASGSCSLLRTVEPDVVFYYYSGYV